MLTIIIQNIIWNEIINVRDTICKLIYLPMMFLSTEIRLERRFGHFAIDFLYHIHIPN